jgi:hypothetical protein
MLLTGNEHFFATKESSSFPAGSEFFDAFSFSHGILNRKFPKHKNFPKRDATTPHR